MTRLALAKTTVQGTVTLQGNTYTFSGSGSGTATADKVPKAKKLAVAASNTAATAVARASIDKILAENSALLSDLEITSLISNNLSTTVVAFKPIALSSVATTTDGVNYTLKPNTIIRADQWLTVSNGINLNTGKYPFTNNGYFQVGDNPSSVSTTLKVTTTASVKYSADASNNGTCEVYDNGESIIDAGVTFENYDGGCLENYGILANNGTITNTESTINNIYSTIQNVSTFNNSTGATINNGPSSYIENVSSAYNNLFNNRGTINNSSWFSTNGTFYNYKGATITNNGDESYVNNVGIFTNNGTIINSAQWSQILNYNEGATFTNNNTITNSGSESFVANYNSAIFTNRGTISNSGDATNVTNYDGGTFNNDGTVNNINSSSSTTNTSTWTGTGTCCSGTTDCPGTCSGTS